MCDGQMVLAVQSVDIRVTVTFLHGVFISARHVGIKLLLLLAQLCTAHEPLCVSGFGQSTWLPVISVDV